MKTCGRVVLAGAAWLAGCAPVSPGSQSVVPPRGVPAFLMPRFTPPSRDPAAVAAGVYRVEPGHTQVMFSVLHMGISAYWGVFSGASGWLVVVAGHPEADRLEVSVPVNSVRTTSAVLDTALTGASWLDARRFPVMVFRSTKVVPTGAGMADVTGDLTLHGVTRSVTLAARFVGVGRDALSGRTDLGFSVTGTIRRGDFGVRTEVPLVSDATQLVISAAFTR